MSQPDVSVKCNNLYNAFSEVQQAGNLKSLKDAEILLGFFGAKMEDKKCISFDLQLGNNQTYEERLYEYQIPIGNGLFSTFYVDKNLGFQCGERLPKSYQKVIHKLHKAMPALPKANSIQVAKPAALATPNPKKPIIH